MTSMGQPAGLCARSAGVLEVSIGHALIADALSWALQPAVQAYLDCMPRVCGCWRLLILIAVTAYCTSACSHFLLKFHDLRHRYRHLRRAPYRDQAWPATATVFEKVLGRWRTATYVNVTRAGPIGLTLPGHPVLAKGAFSKAVAWVMRMPHDLAPLRRSPNCAAANPSSCCTARSRNGLSPGLAGAPERDRRDRLRRQLLVGDRKPNRLEALD